MLLDEIEKLRKQMNTKAETRSLNDVEVIEISQKLDELLVKYYKMQTRNDKKLTDSSEII